jgi:hypothetical protein
MSAPVRRTAPISSSSQAGSAVSSSSMKGDEGAARGPDAGVAQHRHVARRLLLIAQGHGAGLGHALDQRPGVGGGVVVGDEDFKAQLGLLGLHRAMVRSSRSTRS